MLPRSMPRPGHESVVLVTGFPSFLAKKLVLHLVSSEPGTLVIAVVLPRLLVDARRVVDSLDLADRQRIVLMEGDAAAIDLGLSGAELKQLGREVDRIHHVAHASYLGVDKPTAEALNVVGAGEILEVARLVTGLRCLVLHSTAFVSGDRRGTVYEEELPEGASYRSVIEETRAKAERLARRAAKQLPIAIVRPTMVVGDSGTGEVERLDLPYLFVLLLLAAPADLALPIGARG
jgi:thioester reductase-like protein